MYKNICIVFIISMLLFILSIPSHAENFVSGTVSDMSGAPVQDAQITVISDYMVRQITYTDENGNYQVALPYYPVAVEEQPVQTFSLLQNYPNPFNPGTTIPYTLSESSHVELTIYSILGQKVRTLVSDYQSPGKHRVYWNGFDQNGYVVAAGVYLYTLSSDGSFQAKKMLLLDGYAGAGISKNAAVQKTAKTSQTKVEEQSYTVLVKAPGYMIYDETIDVGESDYPLDISLEETQDAGTYVIPDIVEEWWKPDLRSYPGGFGTVVLSLEQTVDFEGTVSLSLEAKPEYHARLTSYVLDKEHPKTEWEVYPDAEIVIPNNVFELEDSVRVLSHHAGITDTLQLRISITHYDGSPQGILNPFVEWISTNYPQYSMFNKMDWIASNYCPGCTGGQVGAYINESFEIVSTWGGWAEYRYYKIRPREKNEYIFAARQSDVFEEIPVEDYRLEKTVIQGEFK